MTTEPAFLFGTVGAPISTPKRPGGSPGAIAHSRSLGLTTLELAWVRSVSVTEASCAVIKAAGEAHAIALSIHAPYFINLNADAEEWPKSRKRLMAAAHYGHLAGATDIIFHPGSYFQQPPAEVLKIAIPRLKGCVDELRAADNPVTLRPETMGKSAMLGSLEDILAMAAEIPGVDVCIDIAHLHARPGDGSINTPAEFDALLNAVRNALGAAALQRLHIHISGIEYGPKGEKNHLTLTEGDLRWREFLQVLQQHGAAGRLLCESPVMEEDALLLQSTWAELTG